MSIRRRAGREAAEVRLRTEVFEDAARRLELEGGRLVVAEQAAGLADEHARPGDLVRRLERLPGVARARKATRAAGASPPTSWTEPWAYATIASNIPLS